MAHLAFCPTLPLFATLCLRPNSVCARRTTIFCGEPSNSRREPSNSRRELSRRTAVIRSSHGRDSIIAHGCEYRRTDVRHLSHSCAQSFSLPCDVFLTAVRRVSSRRKIVGPQRKIFLSPTKVHFPRRRFLPPPPEWLVRRLPSVFPHPHFRSTPRSHLPCITRTTTLLSTFCSPRFAFHRPSCRFFAYFRYFALHSTLSLPTFAAENNSTPEKP